MKDRRRMAPTANTLLMFAGKAEEAMNFYVSLLPNSRILAIRRYGPGQPGPEGSVIQATFTLAGREFMAIDSVVKHPFTFTPATSIFVTCATADEVDDLVTRLGDRGQVFMPLGEYPFSPRFSWLADRFGVSWQVTMAAGA